MPSPSRRLHVGGLGREQRIHRHRIRAGQQDEAQVEDEARSTGEFAVERCGTAHACSNPYALGGGSTIGRHHHVLPNGGILAGKQNIHAPPLSHEP